MISGKVCVEYNSFVNTPLQQTDGGEQRLVAIGISVTAPEQADAIRETVAELRQAVAVPIFLGGSAINGPDHAKLLGADFGLLGRCCAAKLEQQLVNRGADQYGVVNRRRLQSAAMQWTPGHPGSCAPANAPHAP